ncbi:MAG TPA: hypothetical protein DDZ33_10895 [Clostridium sp.]|nr:hypothetical protein [Clostridium sp.]
MCKSENKCSLRIYDGEKWLYGMAAVLYDLNHNYLGYDAFKEEIISKATAKATEKVVEVLTPIIYDEIIEEMDRPKLKLVK